jgi:hypothetical protein
MVVGSGGSAITVSGSGTTVVGSGMMTTVLGSCITVDGSGSGGGSSETLHVEESMQVSPGSHCTSSISASSLKHEYQDDFRIIHLLDHSIALQPEYTNHGRK